MSGNGWSCLMREYGFQRLGSEIVMRLQMRVYEAIAHPVPKAARNTYL